jgi:hypothetical protein
MATLVAKWCFLIELKVLDFQTSCEVFMKTTYSIRQLVEKALDIKKLTPEIENEINSELTQMGYISDVDYEALELLMAEMDAGRIQLVASI